MDFKKYYILVLIFFCSFASLKSQDEIPKLRQEDRTRIAEAYAINENLADELWNNWSKTKFSLILITSDYEFLIGHPSPSTDFILTGYDSLLKSNIYYRKRVFQENLLATFNPVKEDPLPSVIVGIPEKTGKKSTAWVITLLHEHFHQYQYTYPDYYNRVNDLKLTGGDETGMWMLNYPFPYDSLSLSNKFNELSRNLLETINSVDSGNFNQKALGYYQLRKNLTDSLKEDDYKYFSFQLWQEGVSMYTELMIARLAAEKHTPSADMQSLPDYVNYKETAQAIISNIVSNLKELTLSSYKRVAFYYIGACEAILLDKLNPEWKNKYLTDKFYLENYLNR